MEKLSRIAFVNVAFCLFFAIGCVDIKTVTVTGKVNGIQKKISFAAQIKNIGDKEVKGPFHVVIGVTDPGGVYWETKYPGILVPETVTIPINGTYTTDFAVEQAWYPNSKYVVYINANSDKLLKESNYTNNHLQMDFQTFAQP